LREASLRRRAHDGVGASDNCGRFLRQEVETESAKHKNPQIPENEKQIDKKKTNKMPM
jgi:hypothetical protein